MGAEYLFYMKSIETYARAFLALIISGIGTVYSLLCIFVTISVKCEDARTIDIKSYMDCLKKRHGKFVLHQGNLLRGIDNKTIRRLGIFSNT